MKKRLGGLGVVRSDVGADFVRGRVEVSGARRKSHGVPALGAAALGQKVFVLPTGSLRPTQRAVFGDAGDPVVELGHVEGAEIFAGGAIKNEGQTALVHVDQQFRIWPRIGDP